MCRESFFVLGNSIEACLDDPVAENWGERFHNAWLVFYFWLFPSKWDALYDEFGDPR